MVEVRVRDQDVVDRDHLFEREVAHPGARVDQDVRVQQERGGAAASGNRSRTTENADLHVGEGRVEPGRCHSPRVPKAGKGLMLKASAV